MVLVCGLSYQYFTYNVFPLDFILNCRRSIFPQTGSYDLVCKVVLQFRGKSFDIVLMIIWPSTFPLIYLLSLSANSFFPLTTKRLSLCTDYFFFRSFYFCLKTLRICSDDFFLLHPFLRNFFVSHYVDIKYII